MCSGARSRRRSSGRSGTWPAERRGSSRSCAAPAGQSRSPSQRRHRLRVRAPHALHIGEQRRRTRNLLIGLAAQADTNPPAFPVKDVAETFFGTVVHDPYRALENKTAPEVVSWSRGGKLA